MTSIFLSSSLEAKQKYSSIQLISQENVETKPYNGKDYRLYGKVDLETNLVTKITKLFQFIAVALLIPATCGVIIAFTSYQDLLKRKLQAISKTTVNIYVLEILKESIASQPQKSPAKDPKNEGNASISSTQIKTNVVQNLPPPQVDLQSEKTADHEDKNKESVENEGEESVKSEVIDDPLEDLFPDSTQLSPKAKEIHHFIQERNFDEALRAMKDLSDVSERNKFVKFVVGDLFKQNLIDQAVTVLDDFAPTLEGKKEYNLIRKDFASTFCRDGDCETAKKCFNNEYFLAVEFFSKKGEELFEEGEFDQAFKIATNWYLKEDFYVKLTEAFIEQENFESALKATQWLSSVNGNSYAFSEKIACICLEKDKLEEALKAAKLMRYEKENEYRKKISEKYLAKDDLEQALECSKTLPYEIKTQIAGQVANRYLELGKLEQALECSKGLSYIIETQIAGQVVNKYIELGELEKALDKEIKLTHEQEKERAIKISEVYFQNGKFKEGIGILKDVGISQSNISPLYKKLALECCRLGKYEDSKEFLEDFPILEREKLTKETFCKIAEEYYSNGNLEKAEEVLSYLRSDLVEDMYLKIAEAYIEQNKLESAEASLRKVVYEYNERDKLRAKLAEEYIELNDLDHAVEFVIFNEDHGQAKALYIDIAKKYKKQGYETKALETLGRIIKHGRLIDLEWKSIAEEYWKENNYENTLSAIQRSGLKKGGLW